MIRSKKCITLFVYMHSPKNYFSLTVASLLLLAGITGCGQTSLTPSLTSASTTASQKTTTKQVTWCDQETRAAVMSSTPKKDEVWISSEFFNGTNHETTIRHVCQDTTELFSFSAPDSFHVTTTNNQTLVTSAQGTLVMGGFRPADGHPRLTTKTKPFQKIVYTKDLSDPKKIPVALYYADKDTQTETELMAIVQTIKN